MPQRDVAPYGSWRSPISAKMVIASGRDVSDPRVDGQHVWFLESRPDEGGRVVLRRWSRGAGVVDVSPEGTNVRTRVHEYGGGAWAVRAGTVVLSNFADGHVHVVQDGVMRPLVQVDGQRFADFSFDPARDRVVAVREDHTLAGEPVNSVVSIDLATGEQRVLCDGHDFFSDPRVSADGSRLCWMSWDRPLMPWDGTSLWVADLDANGRPGPSVLVAGGAAESVQSPAWAPDGSLVVVSDRTGWWNAYRWRDGALHALAPMEAECGRPQWVFGDARVAVGPDGRVWAIASGGGKDTLLELHDDAGPTPVVSIGAVELSHLHAGKAGVALVGSHPQHPTAILLVDAADLSLAEVCAAPAPGVDPAWLSMPEHVTFPTSDGETAHANYYPPTNPDHEAPPGERPPLVVLSHGGPTYASSLGLHLNYQFWTSRGFAVVDVDYRGSTGYGRAYRDRLLGAWGIVDLDDCTNVAEWLAEQGLADPNRLAIKGGSAGGYTTLCALALRDTFACGVSYFGVADVAALARDTHKFESRYMDRLIGPYPEEEDLYRERSPIHHLDGLNCPLLLLQGEDDEVVPPSQADEMAEVLRRKGIPFAYLLFPGEGHGFRTAAVQRRCLDAELSFFAQVFGFEPSDEVERLELVGREP